MGKVLALGLVAVLGFAGAAQAQSLLQDISRSVQRIDRKLCKLNPHAASCHAAARKARHAKPQKSVAPLRKTAEQPAETPAAALDAASSPKPPMPKLKPKDLLASAPPPAAAPQPAKPVLRSTEKLPPPAPKAVAPDVPPAAKPPDPPKPQVAMVPTSPPSVDGSGCLANLRGLGATFAPVPQPSSNPSCAVETPVRLLSLSSGGGAVKLPDQPIVNCAFAVKLSQWVATRVAPLAQSDASSPLAAMGTGPGFDCRGRNGDTSAKMSEHATGNAVDIVYLTLADKRRILVKDALDEKAPGFALLRDVRASACQDFTTVLGPGANAAHAEHFHVDLEQRRAGSTYRLCE